jgi:hypothetical protein
MIKKIFKDTRYFVRSINGRFLGVLKISFPRFYTGLDEERALSELGFREVDINQYKLAKLQVQTYE